MLTPKMVRPDAKGRITLGHLTDGVSGYSVTKDKSNKIILVPYVEIPEKEKWLFENKAALESVKRGLKNAAEGKIHDLGSFSKFIKDE